jgi:hypothetical protein
MEWIPDQPSAVRNDEGHGSLVAIIEISLRCAGRVAHNPQRRPHLVWISLPRPRRLRERRGVRLGTHLRDVLFDPCGSDHRAGVEGLGPGGDAVAVSGLSVGIW